ncbi:hypothetical protein D3C73_1320060 [compost metagenome]
MDQIGQGIFGKQRAIVHALNRLMEPERKILAGRSVLMVTQPVHHRIGHHFEKLGQRLFPKARGDQHRLDITQKFMLERIGLGRHEVFRQQVLEMLVKVAAADPDVENPGGAELVEALMG